MHSRPGGGEILTSPLDAPLPRVPKLRTPSSGRFLEVSHELQARGSSLTLVSGPRTGCGLESQWSRPSF